MAEQQQQKAQTVDMSKLGNEEILKLLAQSFQSQQKLTEVQTEMLERQNKKDEQEQAKQDEITRRLARDRAHLLEQMRIKLHLDAKRQSECGHVDRRGSSTIYPISNYPDQMLRGICVGCGLYIEPEHLEPNAEGKMVTIPKHPMYNEVLRRDRELYAEFIPSVNY
jgi:hypothetical protein